MARGMGRAALLLLLAVRTAGERSPPPGNMACATQEQLFGAFLTMRGVCVDQLGEAAMPWGDSPFPITCLSAGCARLVRRIAAACGPLLRSSGFYDEYSHQLNGTVDLCRQEAPPPTSPPTYPIGGGGALDACGGSLVDYLPPPPGAQPAPFPAGGRAASALRAPPGQAVRLGFRTLWLPPGATLTLFDGADDRARELVALSGTALPAQTVSSSSTQMYVVLQLPKPPAPAPASPPPLALFSATLGCRCVAPGSCGPHGSCNAEGDCVCSGGFLGPRCDDPSCVGIDCGAHGTCVTGGRCVCGTGWGGDRCQTRIGPCGGEYTTLGDDNAWRRTTQHGGTHCDAPNPGWGRGPYTPLGAGGGKWYRFDGAAVGNSLAVAPVRLESFFEKSLPF